MSTNLFKKSPKIKDQSSFYRWFGLYFLTIFLFLISPIFSIIFSIIIVIQSKDKSNASLYLLSIVVVSYLGFINATKLEESDLVTYLSWYDAAKHSSLLQFFGDMSLIGTEPGFTILTYFLANIPYSNHGVFVFSTTIIIYGIISAVTIKISKTLTLNNRLIAALLIVFLFYPPIFGLSSVVIRQLLAACFVLWFFSERCMTGRNRWWILVASALIHSSSLFFLIFIGIRKYSRFSKSISFIISFLSLIISSLFFNLMMNTLSSLPVLNKLIYILNSDADSVYDASINFSLLPIFMVALLTCLSFYMFFLKSLKLPNLKTKQTNEFMLMVMVLGVLFLIAFYIPQTKDLAGRMYFYIYLLLFLVVILFVSNIQFKNMIYFVMAVMPVYFFYKIQHGALTYAPLEKIMVNIFL